jgi:hypothetical protein
MSGGFEQKSTGGFEPQVGIIVGLKTMKSNAGNTPRGMQTMRRYFRDEAVWFLLWVYAYEHRS